MDAILITGGAGFMGSHFVEAVIDRCPGLDVHVLDALTYAGNLDNLSHRTRESPRFTFWHGNVCNAELVSEVAARVDTVVHFAAETHVARSIYDTAVFYQTDVLGTQVVANQVLKHKRIRRFVHVSTSEVYGSAETDPMTEDHPLNPLTPYASAKCGADRLVYSYYRTYGLPIVTLRPFNQYGPNQHLEKCVPRFVTSALSGQPLTVHGDGSAARDWVYVSDTCAAILAALEAPIDRLAGQVINIGTGVATDVVTIAREIVALTGGDDSLVTFMEDRPGQVERHISSKDRARRLLGWSARTSLDRGLERTIAWYRDHGDWWRRLVWMRDVLVTLPDGRKVRY